MISAILRLARTVIRLYREREALELLAREQEARADRAEAELELLRRRAEAIRAEDEDNAAYVAELETALADWAVLSGDRGQS